jgi:exopolysaccharide production protein ExoQ
VLHKTDKAHKIKSLGKIMRKLKRGLLYRETKLLIAAILFLGLLIIDEGSFLYFFRVAIVSGASPSLSAASRTIPIAILFLTNIILISLGQSKIKSLLCRERLHSFVLFLLLATLFSSSLWSLQPEQTFKQSLHFLNATLLGINMAAYCSDKERINIIGLVCATFLILSLCLVLALPELGVTGMGKITTQYDIIHAGTWKGHFPHKNYMGLMMAFSTLLFSFLFLVNPTRVRWRSWLGLGLSFCMVIGSTSRNALLTLFLSGVLTVFLKRFLGLDKRARRNALVALAMTCMPAFFLAPRVLSVLGRDFTFSGRTVIWEAVWAYIHKRPFHGFGYSAFWRELCGTETDCEKLGLHWNPYTAHNGFLDAALSSGLLGFVLVILSFALFACKAFECFSRSQDYQSLFLIAFLVFWILINLFESFLLDSRFFWSVYVASILGFSDKGIANGSG